MLGPSIRDRLGGLCGPSCGHCGPSPPMVQNVVFSSVRTDGSPKTCAARAKERMPKFCDAKNMSRASFCFPLPNASRLEPRVLPVWTARYPNAMFSPLGPPIVPYATSFTISSTRASSACSAFACAATRDKPLLQDKAKGVSLAELCWSLYDHARQTIVARTVGTGERNARAEAKLPATQDKRLFLAVAASREHALGGVCERPGSS